MSTINELKNQLEKLKTIIAQIEQSATTEPKGSIIIKRKADGRTEYYYHPNDTRSESKYLSMDNKPLISSLLQKRYNHEILKSAKEQSVIIEKFVINYDINSLQNILLKYDKMSRSLLKVYEKTDEDYASLWKKEKYIPNSFRLPDSDYVTVNKEHVRSKSEVIIANCLNSAGIPYKYECPLELLHFQTVYPDFTILNKRTREVWYWEHFGKMDSDEYRSKAFKKIASYAEIGLLPGAGLITTFEDFRSPLNIQFVNKIIKSMLL